VETRLDTEKESERCIDYPKNEEFQNPQYSPNFVTRFTI